MLRPPLVPLDLELPRLVTDRYRLEPLGPRWLVIDHASVIKAWDHLDGVWGPVGTLPPVETFTLEHDALELAWHQREFNCRQSLTWIAVTPDDGASLGAFYVFGSPRPEEVGAICFTTAVEDDARFHDEVRAWLAAEWAFPNVVWPGRHLPWNEW